MKLRIMSAAIAASCLTLLLVAAWLTPSPKGFGTHEQLQLRSGHGLTACTWVALTGKPCPTCGMTTAFAHAADGDFLKSFMAQPMGCVLALGVAIVFWGALERAATGTAMGAVLSQAMGMKVVWLGLAALAAAWAYKWVFWPLG